MIRTLIDFSPHCGLVNNNTVVFVIGNGKHICTDVTVNMIMKRYASVFDENNLYYHFVAQNISESIQKL